MTVASKIRCAVYTRKSSDEGLEQSVKSLDSQLARLRSVSVPTSRGSTETIFGEFLFYIKIFGH